MESCLAGRASHCGLQVVRDRGLGVRLVDTRGGGCVSADPFPHLDGNCFDPQWLCCHFFLFVFQVLAQEGGQCDPGAEHGRGLHERVQGASVAEEIDDALDQWDALEVGRDVQLCRQHHCHRSSDPVARAGPASWSTLASLVARAYDRRGVSGKRPGQLWG